jgi:hypothetical protein
LCGESDAGFQGGGDQAWPFGTFGVLLGVSELVHRGDGKTIPDALRLASGVEHQAGDEAVPEPVAQVHQAAGGCRGQGGDALQMSREPAVEERAVREQASGK